MMFLSRFLSGRSRQKRVALLLLASLNKQSRHPAFFSDEGVPDTLEGRFEVVTLHTALLLRRLRDLGPEGKALAVTLFEDVFDSFDHGLRESGVGDLTVAKKIRILGEAFYGRAKAYDAALKENDTISAVIHRNLLPDGNQVVIDQVTKYTNSLSDHLLTQSEGRLLVGIVDWLDPSEFIS